MCKINTNSLSHKSKQTQLGPLFRVSQGRNQGVSRVVFPTDSLLIHCQPNPVPCNCRISKVPVFLLGYQVGSCIGSHFSPYTFVMDPSVNISTLSEHLWSDWAHSDNLVYLPSKCRTLPCIGGSHLKFYLLRRLRSGGSQFEASLGKEFPRFYLQNNQSKMDWRCCSSGRAPAFASVKS
jgi:hypothetical protein